MAINYAVTEYRGTACYQADEEDRQCLKLCQKVRLCVQE